MLTKALLLGTAVTSIYFFDALKDRLDTYTHHSSISGYVLLAAISTIVLSAFASTLSVALTFAWNCFLKPLGKNGTQEGRLNSFYEGQASVSIHCLPVEPRYSLPLIRSELREES